MSIIEMIQTNKLRWVKCEAEMNGPPVAMTPFYVENGDQHYKLQQYWQNTTDSQDGKWIDIEIDYS